MCTVYFTFKFITTFTREFRIQDLELAVKKMRQQQEQLQKRLKDEMETKAKLEV